MDAREAAPRTDQRLVQVADVRQIGREDDLAALRAHHAVRDGEEAVQVLIAVRARLQQVVGVLDEEGVVRAGDELDEHLVGRHRLHVAGVQRHGSSSPVLRRDISPRMARIRRVLPVPGGPCSTSTVSGASRIARDEAAHAALDLRVGAVEQHVVRHLLDRRALQPARAVRKCQSIENIGSVMRVEPALASMRSLACFGACHVRRPDVERARAVVRLAAAVGHHEHPVRRPAGSIRRECAPRAKWCRARWRRAARRARRGRQSAARDRSDSARRPSSSARAMRLTRVTIAPTECSSRVKPMNCFCRSCSSKVSRVFIFKKSVAPRRASPPPPPSEHRACGTRS